MESVRPDGQQGDEAPCERVCEHLEELCGDAPVDCVNACAEQGTLELRRCLLATTDCGRLSECDDADGTGVDDGACEGDACDAQSACNRVDCDGHGECKVLSESAVCLCEEGYLPASSDALTCVPRSDGWGYDFDADSSAERARMVLEQIDGEWFPEESSWTVRASDYASDGYYFQSEGLSGAVTYYVDDLLRLQTTQAYDRRSTPDTMIRKVSAPLSGGTFDGFHAIELKPAQSDVVTTLLIRVEQVGSSTVTDHDVLSVAACPSVNREGVARPALTECVEQAYASAYVRSILGKRAYAAETRW